MRFVSKEVNHDVNGVGAEIYVPEHPDEEILESEGRLMIAVEIGNETRYVSRRVLQMIMRFSQNPEERRALSHDCAVFALACYTDDPQEGIGFDPEVRKVGMDFSDSKFSLTKDHPQEPRLRLGQIGFTVNALPFDADFWDSSSGWHIIVKATAGSEAPLYASRLGKGGPQGLHTFEALSEFYPAKTAGRVDRLTVQDLLAC